MNEKALSLTQSDRNWLAGQIRDAGRKADDDKKRFCESLMRIVERSESEATDRLSAILDELEPYVYLTDLSTGTVQISMGMKEDDQGPYVECAVLHCPKLAEAMHPRMMMLLELASEPTEEAE